MKVSLKKVDECLKEKLRDPYFRELYELEQQKLLLVKKIIDYRIKNKITQEELAKRAGVTQQHISKIENNDFSSFPTLFKVLAFVGFKVRVVVETIRLKPAEQKQINRTLQKLAT